MNPEIPTEPLTADQVNAAMVRIVRLWPNQKLDDAIRDTWRRKLGTLRQGEFQPALDAWLDGPNSEWRPDVGAFMAIVHDRRAAVARPVWQPHPDTPERPDRDLNLTGIAKVRELLRREALDSSVPDARTYPTNPPPA